MHLKQNIFQCHIGTLLVITRSCPNQYKLFNTRRVTRIRMSSTNCHYKHRIRNIVFLMNNTSESNRPNTTTGNTWWFFDWSTIGICTFTINMIRITTFTRPYRNKIPLQPKWMNQFLELWHYIYICIWPILKILLIA